MRGQICAAGKEERGEKEYNERLRGAEDQKIDRGYYVKRE